MNFVRRVLAAVVEPVERHLQRDFHAGRAVVGVEHLRQRRAPGLARRDRQQALGQLDRRLVREAGEDHLFQRAAPARAIAAAMRGSAWPNRLVHQLADRIQVAAAVCPISQAPSPRAIGTSGSGVGVLAHLRARMPQHGQVARPPAIGVRYHRRHRECLSSHPRIIAASRRLRRAPRARTEPRR